MFKSVLIANRGAIATRIIRTLKKLNIRSVAIYHEADAESKHVLDADLAISLGSGSVQDTYLNIEKIIAIAKAHNVQAIHPGYGFLSENTDFVSRCEKEALIFIGPSAEQITLFGLKHEARKIAEQAKVPLVPGSPLLNNYEQAEQWAKTIGFPVILKSTAGGGGIGMQVCHHREELEPAWESVQRLGNNYFANSGVFIEKFIAKARHLEVQIFGDGQGDVISFGERDCSAQRRNQKVIEETPAPNISEDLRQQLAETAERLMAAINYQNAGTVEYIFDTQKNTFYFLEVNTRLQVEHGVTEQVWGIDLVELMLKQAAGSLGPLKPLKAQLRPQGHAIQARIYAENPYENFQPSAGLLSEVEFSTLAQLRVDTWVARGIEVPALFDPMLAKIIAFDDNRPAARQKLEYALAETRLYGIETNLNYVKDILANDLCQAGELLTSTLSTLSFQPDSITILQAGTQTTLQDYPGRTGLWHIGCPPSGPMDNLNFRLANALLHNEKNAAALEITLNGPSLKFNTDCVIALCGARIEADIDGGDLPMYQSVAVRAGSTVSLGKIDDAGARCYLAVNGGFQCPDMLGSKSTFTLGQFGGHNGRAVRSGDVLHLSPNRQHCGLKVMPSASQPQLTNTWNLRVIYGPHGAPDFFTDDDIQRFFEHEWEVHYNSSRTGIRLIGPKPQWARESGGEAGLHPSNIHDNAYAFGTVDFTGDMPVILGPDGPSLGGFVCPATVIQADLWKLGQLRAGSKLKFIPVDLEQAVEEEKLQLAALEKLSAHESQLPVKAIKSSILFNDSFKGDELIIRAAGDHFILIELGPLELDIERRFKIHALMLWLEAHRLSGMRELTPGIRSLQIHYDAQEIEVYTLIQHIQKGTTLLEEKTSLTVPSRIIHLPLSWDDEACQQAIEKYMQSVRQDAPWCPSNLEFIRRMNGLESIRDVKDILFNASYLVMGLGDVYLGAPVATPIDPRHRLVTTKYNPARTWTAENSVGIGGAYLCVYGMEGPGGYQFVGRTLQMWNRYRQTECFTQPWLLRFFDQIRFYEVSQEELKDIRRDFPLGKFSIQIEQEDFDLTSYQNFITQNSDAINTFENKRRKAFQKELDQWRKDDEFSFDVTDGSDISAPEEAALPSGVVSVDSPISGSVWQLKKNAGDVIKKGETLMIIESMKMEFDISAPVSGTLHSIQKLAGNTVTSGQSLLWIAESNCEEP